MKQASKEDLLSTMNYLADEAVPINAKPHAHRPGRDARILRFRKSERMVHWALAIPFLVCYATALILVIFYNPQPLRPYRDVFSWMHRISGVCLIVLPILAVVRSRGDYKIHFYNIKQAWSWTLSDVKWLLLMGLAAISRKVALPEQGKFNAAEKVNFMMLMTTYPLYILTGVLIWVTYGAFLPWVIHFLMAVLATPLILGHLYMAVINPSSRRGLQGMISGFVDRQWAKHHYRRWYRENFEKSRRPHGVPTNLTRLPLSRARIRCPSCCQRFSFPWEWLVRKISEVSALFCPNCGTEISALSVLTEPQALDAIRSRLESGRFEQALRRYESSPGSSGDVRVHYYLGLAFEGVGCPHKAMEQYQTFLGLRRNTDTAIAEAKDAKERLARLKRKTG